MANQDTPGNCPEKICFQCLPKMRLYAIKTTPSTTLLWMDQSLNNHNRMHRPRKTIPSPTTRKKRTRKMMTRRKMTLPPKILPREAPVRFNLTPRRTVKLLTRRKSHLPRKSNSPPTNQRTTLHLRPRST